MMGFDLPFHIEPMDDKLCGDCQHVVMIGEYKELTMWGCDIFLSQFVSAEPVRCRECREAEEVSASVDNSQDPGWHPLEPQEQAELAEQEAQGLGGM